MLHNPHRWNSHHTLKFHNLKALGSSEIIILLLIPDTEYQTTKSWYQSAENYQPNPLFWSTTPIAPHSLFLHLTAKMDMMELQQPTVTAPELPNAIWVGPNKPITLAGLRGRLVLLNFGISQRLIASKCYLFYVHGIKYTQITDFRSWEFIHLNSLSPMILSMQNAH